MEKVTVTKVQVNDEQGRPLTTMLVLEDEAGNYQFAQLMSDEPTPDRADLFVQLKDWVEQHGWKIAE